MRLAAIVLLASCACAVAGSYNSTWYTNYATNAVICYDFAEGSGASTADRTTNANNGIISTSVLWTNRPNAGGALWFPGNTNCLTIPLNASLQFQTNVTIAFWAYVPGTQNLNGFAVGCREPTYSAAAGFQFYGLWVSGTFYLDVFPKGAATGGYKRHTTNSLSGWHHFGAVMEGSTLTATIDGISRGENVGSPVAFLAPTNNYVVGRRPLSDGAATGVVSDLIILPYADASQVTNHMYLSGTNYESGAAVVATPRNDGAMLELWRSQL